MSHGKVETIGRATLGAGCFWGVEEAFRQLDGVLSTAVGFMGGTLEQPTYEDVCAGESGHAEVVEILFDPAEISFSALLEEFFRCHDPTTLNRQGPDFGLQYRSVIFCHADEQRRRAIESREKAARSGRFEAPIVTEIATAGSFFRAGEVHQQYLAKLGRSSCAGP
ncbi:MAG: peptide-methionine (S)-S-oxide reductase MsrA [Planctomycetota bacterium]